MYNEKELNERKNPPRFRRSMEGSHPSFEKSPDCTDLLRNKTEIYIN